MTSSYSTSAAAVDMDGQGPARHTGPGQTVTRTDTGTVLGIVRTSCQPEPEQPVKVPCAKACGAMVNPGSKTGMCVACVREAWRTGELTHTRKGNTTQRRETPSYAASLQAMTRSLGRRIGERGDIENLPRLTELIATADDALHQAVSDLHDAGYSWADIGRVLHTTRNAAQMRFGR